MCQLTGHLRLDRVSHLVIIQFTPTLRRLPTAIVQSGVGLAGHRQTTITGLLGPRLGSSSITTTGRSFTRTSVNRSTRVNCCTRVLCSNSVAQKSSVIRRSSVIRSSSGTPEIKDTMLRTTDRTSTTAMETQELTVTCIMTIDLEDHSDTGTAILPTITAETSTTLGPLRLLRGLTTRHIGANPIRSSGKATLTIVIISETMEDVADVVREERGYLFYSRSEGWLHVQSPVLYAK
mmetsp:Transcript_3680/g.13224  ORF Transcript_3680/g.13224 Transcript_3680/m.13224 type:complete len:235 (-) Transcript_3680:1804-2508(-)